MRDKVLEELRRETERLKQEYWKRKLKIMEDMYSHIRSLSIWEEMMP